ncbi:hypothetical protein FUAX_44400 (plasmid) [Fulvitalea axinellae]|uniref:Uncharacterized protein n=1 Tax=Fulvitalea axinellae TaxID=1182444 RepID=A0AAU9D7L8_9BACT|nr:hypothetical protein FUAX_44400 [Fulvitalea axinellae]
MHKTECKDFATRFLLSHFHENQKDTFGHNLYND